MSPPLFNQPVADPSVEVVLFDGAPAVMPSASLASHNHWRYIKPRRCIEVKLLKTCVRLETSCVHVSTKKNHLCIYLVLKEGPGVSSTTTLVPFGQSSVNGQISTQHNHNALFEFDCVSWTKLL